MKDKQARKKIQTLENKVEELKVEAKLLRSALIKSGLLESCICVSVKPKSGVSEILKGKAPTLMFTRNKPKAILDHDNVVRSSIFLEVTHSKAIRLLFDHLNLEPNHTEAKITLCKIKKGK